MNHNSTTDRLERIERALAHLTSLVALSLKLEVNTMAKIEDVTAAVAAESSVVNSVVTLLQQLSDQIKAAGTDGAALDAVVASINANKDALAAAVLANTTPA
jgi:hypothetical protein